MALQYTFGVPFVEFSTKSTHLINETFSIIFSLKSYLVRFSNVFLPVIRSCWVILHQSNKIRFVYLET